MQLTWLRAGCASIAECGERTAVVILLNNVWIGSVRFSSTGGVYDVFEDIKVDTREAAESACEAWLDKHDRPQWEDANDWLSWAEWRGWTMHVYRSLGNTFCAICRTEARGCNPTNNQMTIDGAKRDAEKYVREQTGGAA